MSNASPAYVPSPSHRPHHAPDLRARARRSPRRAADGGLRLVAAPAAPSNDRDAPPFEAPPPREEALSRKDRAALFATYLGDVRRHRVLSRDEEHEIAVRYHQTGDRRLGQRLVLANLRLVLKIALEYKSLRRQVTDLVQEGNLGLLHAVEKFDPHRGVKLSSYAAWWIRAYILKYILANARLVKLGTTQAQRRLFFGLRRVRAQLAGGSDVEVGKDQLAASLCVSEKEIDEMESRLASPERSLDWSPHDEDDRPLMECLQFGGAGPDAETETAELQDILGREIATFGRSLTGRERVIFTRRLLCEEPATLAEVAKDFGVSRERVRQIEQRLKERLRKRLRARVGDPFTGEGPAIARRRYPRRVAEA